MKRHLLSALALTVALPLVAQTPAPAAQADAEKIVAVVNGEKITKEKLDQLWFRVGAKMRKQYEKTGGKQAFLDNYIRKRLVLQEALKAGFDKRTNVQLEMEAAKESAMFDLYVRDVLAEEYVSEDQVREYYESHKSDFAVKEKARVCHIVITAKDEGPIRRSREQAMSIIGNVMAELHPYRTQAGFGARFAEAARKYSEDGVREQGGDLGWVEKGLLDPKFEEVAWALRPGTMSGIVETPFGLHLIYLEGKQGESTEAYKQASADIREFLMAQNAAKVMETVNRLTSELRLTSKVSMFPENIN
jgi:parvulin-like peptidyl-prolyl isomerase